MTLSITSSSTISISLAGPILAYDAINQAKANWPLTNEIGYLYLSEHDSWFRLMSIAVTGTGNEASLELGLGYDIRQGTYSMARQQLHMWRVMRFPSNNFLTLYLRNQPRFVHIRAMSAAHLQDILTNQLANWIQDAVTTPLPTIPYPITPNVDIGGRELSLDGITTSLFKTIRKNATIAVIEHPWPEYSVLVPNNVAREHLNPELAREEALHLPTKDTKLLALQMLDKMAVHALQNVIRGDLLDEYNRDEDRREQISGRRRQYWFWRRHMDIVAEWLDIRRPQGQDQSFPLTPDDVVQVCLDQAILNDVAQAHQQQQQEQEQEQEQAQHQAHHFPSFYLLWWLYGSGRSPLAYEGA